MRHDEGRGVETKGMPCNLAGMHLRTIDCALEELGVFDQAMPGIQHDGREYLPFQMPQLVPEKFAGNRWVLE